MQPLKNVRVLVVEDEPLLALELQDLLTDLGCVIAGVAGRLETALPFAGTLEFDVAILDVNLGTERIDRAAETIAGRGLPIVYTTGYGTAGGSGLAPGEVVTKPYDQAMIAAALARAITRP